MARQVPKHIKAKIERMNRLMAQVVELNEELERWLESSGVAADGYDYVTEWKLLPGYEIARPDDFVAKVDNDLKGA